MPYRSLESLFRYFQPAAVEKNKQLYANDIPGVLVEGILNKNGTAFTYADIKNKVDTFTSSKLDVKKAKENAAVQHFQAIGPTGPIKLEDADFWKMEKGEINSVSRIVTKMDKTAIFLVKNPRMSPAVANVDAVGQFLNLMPSTVVSQMIPYLDVQLKYNSNPFYTTTPGVLRFLLGSAPITQIDNNENDMAVYRKRLGKDDYYAGIETFLMPQSLNDMDSLGTQASPENFSGPRRPAPVKPFTPFMSIEGFDMNTKGTGYGMIPTGRATLKLKLHDRARLAEIADLMRGAEGFGKITVTTRYGWSASNTGAENEYTKFVNENLYIVQHWDIVQSNYTFDQSGQISFSITLATKNISQLTNGKTLEYSEKMKSLHVKMEKITKHFSKIAARNLALPAAVTSLVSEGATNGFFTADSKKSAEAIKILEERLKKEREKAPESFPLADSDIRDLINNLKDLIPDAKNKETYSKIIEEDVKSGWTTSFDSLEKTPDPFLPTDKSPRNKYFGSAESVKNMIAAINRFKQNAEVNKATEVSNKVMSFGKLFTHFFGPNLQNNSDADELQIIFYTMNAFCGPMSNRCIAEFPVDMVQLRKGYYEIVKRTRTKNITFDEFVTLLNSTNFQDPRAIGYDRTDLYPAVNKKDANAKVDLKEKTDTKQADWFNKYGGQFIIPMLEIQMETHETKRDEAKPNEPIKKVMRVHIFDKTCSIEEEPEKFTLEEKKERIRSEISVIKIGSNGSTIIAASGGSKTNSAQDTVFALRAYNNKGAGQLGGTAIGEDGLGDQGNIPLRITPMNLSLTTLGCPIARNYQSFFIDFGTGTQLDNRYKVVELNHNLSPGKFVTTWKFIYDNAYAGLVTPKVPLVSDPVKIGEEIASLIKPEGTTQSRVDTPPDVDAAIRDDLKKKQIKSRGKPKTSGSG